jgi:hypothetical protein
MAGPSSRHRPTELEQIQVLNEILDDNIVREYSSDEDYTQLLHQTTHEISDSEHERDGDCHIKGQQGGVSTTLYGATSQHFPVQGRSFVMFVAHSSTPAVTWVLWMCVRSSLT